MYEIRSSDDAIIKLEQKNIEIFSAEWILASQETRDQKS
jgi:hypothetical protein